MTATLKLFGEMIPERLAEVAAADVVVVACGYESRSRFLAERIHFQSGSRFAVGFEEGHSFAYADNLSKFDSLGYRVIHVTDNGLRDWFEELLAQGDGELRLFVDISSQSRARLASIIEALMSAAERRPVRVFFGYSPARFSKPEPVAAPNVGIGPVSPFFAGWSSDPDFPTAMIVGLGYESDRAMGAVEYLEPGQVWALLPHSSIPEYDAALLESNKQLMNEVGQAQVLRYELEDPNATFALLTAIVARLSGDFSVLLLPSGPKLLALLALLLACVRRDVAVWRVSAGANEPVVDRIAIGSFIMFECLFEPAPAAAT